MTADLHVNVNERFNKGESIFDARPVNLSGFELKGYGVHVHGRPGIRDWQNAMLFASGAHEASPYWVGDLLRYAESREDYRERLDQAMHVTGLSRGRLQNLASLCGRVDPVTRRIAPSPEHAIAVAALEKPEQAIWLDRARTEGWTEKELRGRVRAAKANTVIEGQAPTMWDVDVTVLLAVEAQNPYEAERKAWDIVKAALVAKGVVQNASARTK